MSRSEGEGPPPRQPIPIEGSYRLLDEGEVAGFIGSVGVAQFIEGLRTEIEAVYTETGLIGAPRSNMLEGRGGEFATEEIMSCESSDYAVYKRIGSDPERAAEGRSTVYGEMYAVEAGTGQVRLMCSAEHLTALRTATTSALVLSKLRPKIKTLGVVGAGLQGQAHAFAIAAQNPDLKRVLLKDIDAPKAEQGAEELTEIFRSHLRSGADSIEVEAVPSNRGTIEAEADVIVTATFGSPDDAPVLSPFSLRPGTVIAAVGADMEGNRELDGLTHKEAKFVTDELRQSLHEGELQYAATELDIPQIHIDSMRFANYHGWLAGGRVIGIPELLAKTRDFTGRVEPLTIYDSTGFSGQDLAAARLMLRLLKDSDYPMQPKFNAEPSSSLSGLLDPDHE